MKRERRGGEVAGPSGKGLGERAGKRGKFKVREKVDRGLLEEVKDEIPRETPTRRGGNIISPKGGRV